MKKVFNIAFLLISLAFPQIQTYGQNLPVVCGGSKVRYGVTGLPESNYDWEIEGGTIDYNYNDSIDVTWGNTPGIHQLTVTEHTATNCVGSPSTAQVIVSIPQKPNFDGDTINICQGKSTSINPGVNYQSYLWNTGAITQSITTSNQGLYTLQATDTAGCEVAGSVYLAVSGPKKADLDDSIQTCQGQSISISPNTNYTSYLWNTGATTKSISVSNQGTYSLQATDTAGCVVNGSVYLTVNSLPHVNLGNDTMLCTDVTSITLDAGSGYNYYLWSNGQIGSSIIVVSPNTYWVKVTNNNGCVGSDTISVTLCHEMTDIKIPNAFTPNGDGANDTWQILALDNYPNASVEIYDRWGRLVYQAKDGFPSSGWDGTSQGRNLPMDSYFYFIKLNDGSNTTFKGSVTIIR